MRQKSPRSVRRVSPPGRSTHVPLSSFSTVRPRRLSSGGAVDDAAANERSVSPTPNGCAGAATCFGTWDEASVRDQARKNGETEAEAIRASGAFLYTIALGNPGAADPLLQPDLGYLEGLANVDHKTNPAQPAGRSYFAPSADQLDKVFKELAKDLLVRLSR